MSLLGDLLKQIKDGGAFETGPDALAYAEVVTLSLTHGLTGAEPIPKDKLMGALAQAFEAGKRAAPQEVSYFLADDDVIAARSPHGTFQHVFQVAQAMNAGLMKAVYAVERATRNGKSGYAVVRESETRPAIDTFFPYSNEKTRAEALIDANSEVKALRALHPDQSFTVRHQERGNKVGYAVWRG